jgi:hypothetical protein
LFEVDARPGIRYYRQILEALTRSGFASDAEDAQRVTSRLFGAVWAGQEAPRDGGIEEAFGLGLVDHARQRRTPTAVVLLRALAVVAPIREVREAAVAAADGLVAAGLPDSEWRIRLETATAGRCWSYEDAFGDEATLVCEYSLEPDATRALMIQIDHAMFSTATDVSLIDDVDACVRDLQNATQTVGPTVTLRLVEAAWARAVLERAFARTDLIEGVAVGPGFADLRAFALARIRDLPDVPEVLPPDLPAPAAEERRSLIDAFLADPEGQAIGNLEDAIEIANVIVEYAAVYDPSDIGRVSPAKWDIFLNDWLPRRGRSARSKALPDVVRAWSAWSARRRRLAEPMRDALARAVDELLD